MSGNHSERPTTRIASFLIDPAAQVRYASVYAARLVMVGRYGEALKPLSAALSIAHDDPQVAYPILAVSTKIDALVGLHRNREALDLANDALNSLKDGPSADENSENMFPELR